MMTFDAELDVSDLTCPVPLVKTKLKLKSLEAGKILRVVLTDASSILDLKVFSAVSGNVLLDIKKTESKYIVFIQKKT